VKRLVLVSAVWASVAVIPLLTAGCGQKGALYLPPRNGTVVTRPAGTNTTPNAPVATPNTPPTTDQQSSSAPQPGAPVPPGKKNNASPQPPK